MDEKQQDALFLEGFIPPLAAKDLPDTRLPGEDWHSGLLVSQKRAAVVAKRLFPDEVADGSDCRSEIGREGGPCRSCAARNEQWSDRVREVRVAMLEAFGSY